MSLTHQLARALAAHAAGRLDEAEQDCRALLALEPGHADAWHLLGLIQHQRGQSEQAVESIRRAVGARGNEVTYLTNLGIMLLSLARGSEAVAVLERAVDMQPDSAAARFALASALHAGGRLADAEAHYRATAQLHPNAAAYNNLGTVLKDEGRKADAEAAYRRAIDIDPDHARAHYNLGLLLKDTQRAELASASLRRALVLSPDLVEAHVNLGIVLHDLGDLDGATAHARCAVRLAPDDPAAHNNLGAALRDSGDIDGAMQCYAQAMRLQPDLAEAQHNTGVALERTGRSDEALARYKQAQSLRPTFAEAELNAALLMLMSGDFARGWEAYEARWHAVTPRTFSQRKWGGETGGRILVWGEQGLGDEILYAGMVPDLVARGHDITLETDPRLVPLFARSFAGVEVVARSEPPHAATQAGDIQWQVPLAGLGRWLRPNAASFPRRRGYLRADAQRSALFRTDLEVGAPKLIVGVSWVSANARIGRQKSVSLASWAGILKTKGVRFVDLQYGETQAERDTARTDLGVEIEHLDALDLRADIDGVAALAQACDLVISVSNTTAHLAAALGVPTWVLVPATAGNLWYWMRGTDHTPWYPSVSVFRQKEPGRWGETFTAVERKLRLAVTAN